MLIFLPILLFLGKIASGCTYKTDRGTFDLSPLGAQEKSFTVPSSDPGRSNVLYYFSICGNTADTSDCGSQIPTNVCAIQFLEGLDSCYDIGVWDSSGKLTSNTDGFSLEFDNGSKDLCNFARSITFIFKCSEGEPYGSMIATELQDCIYQVTIPTMYVCDDAAISVSDDLSVGSIILIVLLVLITVYFIGGFGFNSYKGSARGLQALPHASFWCTQLPFWVKTGCSVSWAFTMRIFMGIKAKITGVPNRRTTDADADGTYENLD